jgi:hypothetical protein
MNQSKFSLADVFSVIAAMTFGFVCFLSINFLSMGDTMSAAIIASIIALILAGLPLIAKFLKRTRKNFKTSLFFELFFLFCFFLVAFILVNPFSHFFSVFAKKEEMQDKLLANFSVSNNIFTLYEAYANNRIDNYSILLNTAILAEEVNLDEFEKFGFEPGVDPKIQVESRKNTLKKVLFPPNYTEIKNNFYDWLSESSGKIEVWSPIAIVDVINSVNFEIEAKKEKLQEWSKFCAPYEIPCNEFKYDIKIEDVSIVFKEVDKNSPNLFSVIIAVVLYVFMLFSYFIASRPIGPLSVDFFSGLKVLFFPSKKSDNTTL